MNNTKLMDKLFSEGNEDLKAQVTEKIEDAKTNGSSELITDDENLQFADTGDGIVVEDQANDNEVTMIKDNENGDGYELEKITIEPETKTQSDEVNEKMNDLADNMNELDSATEDLKETKDKEMAKAIKEMSQKIFSDIEDLEKELEDIDFKEVKEECSTYAKIAEEILNGPDVKTEVVEGKDGKHVENSAPEVKVDATIGINDAEKAGLKSFSLTFSGNCSPEYIAAVSKAFAEVVPASPEAKDAEKPENKGNDELETVAKDAEELKVEDEKEVPIAESKEYSEEEKPEETKEEVTEETTEETEKEEPKEEVKEETQKNFSACLDYSFNGMNLAPKNSTEKDKVFAENISDENKYNNPCLNINIY